VLRVIVTALWYARNSDIHRVLGIRMVSTEIKRIAEKHEDRLHHSNVEAVQREDIEKAPETQAVCKCKCALV
jgi:hypothetical protein